ncbi:MAG: hypothetical protein P1U37_16150 [Minwuia sp.]|nr:hypothetical protein [Minwuia sp.]
MDLIRNDAQVALNEIVAASRRLAARLRLASEISDSDLFSDPADEVDRLAEELAERQRAEDEDEIPAAPSDEALLVDAAAMRVRLAVADNLAAVRGEWYRDLTLALDQHQGNLPDDARPLADAMRKVIGK